MSAPRPRPRFSLRRGAQPSVGPAAAPALRPSGRRAAPLRAAVFAAVGLGAADTAWATGNGAPSASDAPAASALRTRRWFVRLDAAGLLLHEKGEVTVAGSRVPGNTVRIDDAVTVSADLGYFFTESLAVAGIVGVPPRASFKGANALAAVGVGATARYGPAALLVQYHAPRFMGFRPYVGVGASYTVFADVKGLALQSPKVDNAWGAAFQAGFEYALDERWALHADAVKILVSTRASGNLQGVPVSARITVDPLILRAGLTWRF